METQVQNLFLLEDNPLSSNRIVDFLERKFSNYLAISTFDNGNDLLKSVNVETAIVILDYDLKGEKADLILEQIKKINQNTEVIILSSDDDIATAIDAYRKGARSFVSKNRKTFTRIQSIISSIVYYPAAILERFFGLKQLLAIFIVEIIYIGIVVFVGFQILNNLK
jgi:DNA-binding NarL/FixJ family response regulator